MMLRFSRTGRAAGAAKAAQAPRWTWQARITAGLCAFALAFRPRALLLVLAAVTLVALLPLGVIVLSMDFGEYRALVEERALILAVVLALANVVATTILIAGGVFPARTEGPT